MSEWWSRCRYLVRLLSPRNRRDAEADLEAEVAAHLEIEVQTNLEAGMPPDQARCAALRRFGNVGLAKEQVRESWGVGPLDRLGQDLRYGMRMLGKKRLMTAVAVLSLALGIGANTAVFTVLNAAVHGAPPLYQAPDRLVTVWETAPRQPGERQGVSVPSYLTWKEEPHLFESLAAVQTGLSVSLRLEDHPVQVGAQLANSDLLSTLGVAPLLGRGLIPEEDRAGGAPVAVLAYGAWQSYFGGDPEILGRSISIGGREHTVVGVMPRGFWLADGYTDVWMPLQLGGESSTLDDRRLRVMGRLEPNIGRDEAEVRLASLSPHLTAAYPARQSGWGVRVEPVRSIDAMGGEVPPGFIQLFGALGLVLLIACANIANVMVARGSARQQETAIRSALGAGRFRLIRQLLTESLLLAGAGGTLGLLLTFWGIFLIGHFAPGDLSRSMDLAVDGSVFAFAGLVTVLVGLFSGVAPAVADSRVDVNQMLKQGGESHGTGAPRQHLRSLLVVGEVALTLMLLVGVGLLVKSFMLLKGMDPGFDQDRLMAFLMELPESEYSAAISGAADAQGGGGGVVEISPRAALLFEEVVRRLQQIPEVESAGAACQLPPASGLPRPFRGGRAAWPNDGEAVPTADFNPVNPGFLDTVGARLLRGRGFTPQDAADAPWVAVINQAMARRFWPDRDPVGATVELMHSPGERPRTVVGVVADLRNQGMSRHAVPEIYVPLVQQPVRVAAEAGRSRLRMHFVMRTGGSSESLATAARGAVAAVAPDLAISGLTTMQERLDVAAQEILVATFLNGPIVGLALALTGVGIYGILSFSVSRRIREIGIRIALGAEPSGLLALILKHGLRLVAMGVLLGALGALALGRFLSGLLLDVVTLDPLLVMGAALLLTAVALLASYVPARRATKVDPVTALRYE